MTAHPHPHNLSPITYRLWVSHTYDPACFRPAHRTGEAVLSPGIASANKDFDGSLARTCVIITLHYLTIPSDMITFAMMKRVSAGNKGKLRALTFEEAEEERLNYTLGKSIRERLEYLQRLRVLNYGERATQPIVRKIRVLEGTKRK